MALELSMGFAVHAHTSCKTQEEWGHSFTWHSSAGRHKLGCTHVRAKSNVGEE